MHSKSDNIEMMITEQMKLQKNSLLHLETDAKIINN